MSTHRFRLHHWLPLLCAAMAVLLCNCPARAGFIVSVESVSANAGSTGNTLEVDLTNTGSSAAAIGSFSFGISTTTSNIDFTSATTGTTQSYIFAGDSLFGPTISTSTGQSLIASDLSISGLDTVAAGATVGLGEVFFNVASGTSTGPIAVTLTSFPTTSLSDPFGNNIPITTLIDGKITVVSEPSTLLLALLACPAAVCISWQRKRSAAKWTDE